MSTIDGPGCARPLTPWEVVSYWWERPFWCKLGRHDWSEWTARNSKGFTIAWQLVPCVVVSRHCETCGQAVQSHTVRRT